MTGTARIAFLGDTLLGGAASEVIAAHGYDHPLARIRHLWADADLTVANHEGPLTYAAEPAAKLDTGKKRYWYKGDPESAHALAATGVGVASLANNHVTDFGPEGLFDTMRALDDAGIAHCGAGADDAAAREPAVVTVNGLRIGFLSVMQRYRMYIAEDAYATDTRPGPALLDTDRLAADVAALKARVDLCVVLPHWGRNYRRRTELQRTLAREIVAAGADLIVGHHPHIAHPVRVVDGVPVAYSLGNSAFGSPGRYREGRPPYGVVAVFDVDAGGVTGLDLRLIEVDNAVVDFQPVPASGADAEAFLETLRTDALPRLRALQRA